MEIKFHLLAGILAVLLERSFQKEQLEIEKKFIPNDCPRKSQEGDTLKWYYIGSFSDGTEFHQGTHQSTLGSEDVIPGLDQGLQDMCVGEKRKLTVPPHLAYGEKGADGSDGSYIPPNATLTFEIELQEIFRPSEDPDPRLKDIKIEIQKESRRCEHKTGNGDKIKWNYIGSFLDGKEFDKGTFVARLGEGAHEVIPGVDLAMRGMCEGDKRKMTIPSYLAYGSQGVSGVIPPDSTLIFDVELLQVEPARNRSEL